VQPSLGERCDDGAVNASGVCIGCQVAVCGDGSTTFDEQCDDGNTVSGDGCSALCEREFCGDGIRQPALGEECDDGNIVLGDGCDSCFLP
jgi:cysteine-rich repeat protein